MKKLAITLVSIWLTAILVGCGLLAYMQFFHTPDIVYDSELLIEQKQHIKELGDTIVIEESSKIYQAKQGEGIAILQRQRAICSKKEKKCRLEAWNGESWDHLGDIPMSDLFRQKKPQPQVAI